MKNSKKLKAFTVRLPYDLHDQILARADVNRRTKNAEIIDIIETAIDRQVNTDLRLAKFGRTTD
jgi:predicted transcriptional regulator